MINDPNDLTDRLLPSGQVTSGLVCRYGPPVQSSPEVWRVPVTRTRLTVEELDSLVRAIRALRLGEPSGGAGCPNDDGRTVVIVLSVADRTDVDLWYHASGCQFLQNGYQVSVEVGNPSFYNGFMSAMQNIG